MGYSDPIKTRCMEYSDQMKPDVWDILIKWNLLYEIFWSDETRCMEYSDQLKPDVLNIHCDLKVSRSQAKIDKSLPITFKNQR